MDAKLFDYELPSSYIAQKPIQPRNDARLMILERNSNNIKHDRFFNLCRYLRENDCLVLNNSKVLRCRLKGKKEKTGAAIECFILKKISSKQYQVLLKPSKRLSIGSKVKIGNYGFEVKEKGEYGRAVIEFDKEPYDIFEKFGKVPLPPYIKSNNIKDDDYQTVYAARDGSVAAPTAGLHFTSKQISELKNRGIIFAFVSLNIGLDTFRPIKEQNIEDHKIHSEYYFLEKNEAEKIKMAKAKGGRIITVGTTSARVLETVYDRYKDIRPCSGKTRLYIYPGFRFGVTEAIITNFHLPRSTLLVMISAFAGREKLLNAYYEAKKNNYRFYSFGDCMMII